MELNDSFVSHLYVSKMIIFVGCDGVLVTFLRNFDLNLNWIGFLLHKKLTIFEIVVGALITILKHFKRIGKAIHFYGSQYFMPVPSLLF